MHTQHSSSAGGAMRMAESGVQSQLLGHRTWMRPPMVDESWQHARLTLGALLTQPPWFWCTRSVKTPQKFSYQLPQNHYFIFPDILLTATTWERSFTTSNWSWSFPWVSAVKLQSTAYSMSIWCQPQVSCPRQTCFMCRISTKMLINKGLRGSRCLKPCEVIKG